MQREPALTGKKEWTGTALARVAMASALMALLPCAASPAAAAVRLFDNEAAFNSAAASQAGLPLAFEGFNTLRSRAAVVDFGAFTLTEQGGTSNNVASSISNNRLPTALVEGAGYAYYNDNGASTALFQFSNAINAFGFYVTSNFDGVSNDAGSIVISVDFGDFTRAMRPDQPAFWGIIAETAFSSVRLAMPQESLVGIDAVQFGTLTPTASVPEPHTWAFLLTGFGLVGLVRRRLIAGKHISIS